MEGTITPSPPRRAGSEKVLFQLDQMLIDQSELVKNEGSSRVQ